MSKTIKRGILSIVNELGLLVVALAITASTWDVQHPAAAAAPRETPTPAVHTTQLALPVIHRNTNEAVMLAAPAKMGYTMDAEADSFEAAEETNLLEGSKPSGTGMVSIHRGRNPARTLTAIRGR